MNKLKRFLAAFRSWPYALDTYTSAKCTCPAGAMMQAVYRGNGVRIHVIDIHLGGCAYAESIWRKAGGDSMVKL